MTVTEWNDLLDYAQKLCSRLATHGYTVTAHPYQMHDLGRGVELRVHDRMGGLHTTYASGSSSNYSVYELKASLDNCAERILREC